MNLSADRLHEFDAKPHNRPVGNTPWEQRIRRAENLAAKHPFAAEILGFYVHVARFQEGLYSQLERVSRDAAKGSAGLPPLMESASRHLSPQLEDVVTNTLVAYFPQFLSLVEQKAPPALAQVAHDLRASGPNTWPNLFSQCWTHVDPPTDPEEFLVLAFLQPCAELARSPVSQPAQNSASRLCPYCSRKPTLAILRPQGDGGSRSLLCGFCLTEWEFRRIVCPGCGQEDHAKLPVYTAESFPYIRVECCETCHTYIKSIDMTKNGLAEPLADDLASVPLNLWAQERGYARLHPNLLGM
jgi:FdhE protein